MWLKNLPRVELHQQDMLSKVSSFELGAFDVIYSSFAVHHLDESAKRRLFQACAAILATGGEFVMVDVVREAHQTRDQYIAAYLRMVRTEWTTVDPSHREEVCRHVAQYDFPETFSTLAHMAADAGLKQSQSLGRFGPHELLLFRA